jgi:hypothetical protein
MIKQHHQIRLQPQVQVVMNMDGWGELILKFSTYHDYIFGNRFSSPVLKYSVKTTFANVPIGC